MPRSAVLLCVFIFGCTFSIGAFPVLLPEIGRSGGISDFELGAIAGAFGLARVVADIPAGLFITHHLRRALVLAAFVLIAGVLCLSFDGPLWMKILGRALWGVGHALAMLSGITAIVRHSEPGRHGFVLNAFEMSAMSGVLGGMVVAGLLPRAWAWNVSLVVAASPQLVALLLVPALLRAIPPDPVGASRPLFSRSHAAGSEGDGATRRWPRLTILAFASGCSLALAWSAIGNFILPLRASREFDLDRGGVATVVAIPQIVDAIFLLPLGALADRAARTKVLGVVLLIFAIGSAAIAFGSLPVVVIGCALFGIGLAAWMLPVSLVNRDAPAGSVAWRTATYRVAVDAGIFLGPVVSGFLLGRDLLWTIVLVTIVLLVGIGAALLRVNAAR